MRGADEHELAVRLRGEYREERRAAERDALALRWAERSVVDVVHELARRGDPVAVHYHDLRLQGRIEDAGRDWFALRDRGELVTVHLPAGEPGRWPELEIVGRATAGGCTPSGRDPTFLARLRSVVFAQHLDPRRRLRVLTGARDGHLEVEVLACSADHLYARDREREYVLPLAGIRCIGWSAGG